MHPSPGDDPGFGIENLPYGVVRPPGADPRPAVRVGRHALDLSALEEAGLLGTPPGTFAAATLNPFLELGRPAWSATRSRLVELLSDPGVPVRDALLPLDAVEPVLPVAIGDYVDFYASLEHASNVGRIFRPDAEPLLENWRHLPVAYHGRAGTVVVSGTPIRRPCGQRPPEAPGAGPTFGPERRLDFEAELGFITGPGPDLGTPVAAGAAAEHIFGFVLVNDWSARELQRWEYRPLGPFLGKSFATSISPWIVTLEALEPLRVHGPEQQPTPLGYLGTDEPWALDIGIEVSLAAEGREAVISRTSARSLYWGAAQMLAHATVNGATVRAGDLFASGTVSGSGPASQGCLLELTRDGRDPLELPGGVRRAFLEDGDRVVISARGGGNGRPWISLGEVAGTVAPALSTTSP